MGFVGIVELTLTPNAAIFSMHSTVNIPVKHMFMYFSAFLYASLCRWNCNAYTDKHTAERDRQTDVQAYELPRVPTTSHTVGIDASTTTAIPPFAVSRLSPCLPKNNGNGERPRIGERARALLDDRAIRPSTRLPNTIYGRTCTYFAVKSRKNR